MKKKKETPKAETFKSVINISGHLTPFICPVCNGNGLAANGFYNQISGEWSSISATPEQCRTCQGTGIVWG